MLKPGQVPKEVIVELLAALNSCDCDDCTSVAITAAINAWPEAGVEWHSRGPVLILPLPEENRNE